MQIQTMISKEHAAKLFDKESSLFGCGAFIESTGLL